MSWSPLILIELVLVFGSVLAWGGWELWVLKRDNARAREREAAQAQERLRAELPTPTAPPAEPPPGA